MAKSVDFKQTRQDMLDINKGLKDQISYANELGTLKNKYNKANEREQELLSDVLDKTKDVMKNRKMLSDEQLNTVELHKLERKLIAEGLHDQVRMVQKLKQENRIQKQINRVVNQTAKTYSNIGEFVDNIVKKIPGIGGMLSDVLGTNELGKEMAEKFRTNLSASGGFAEFGKNAGGEFAGGVGVSLMQKGTVSKSADIIRGAIGGLVLLGLAGATKAAFSAGLEDGAKSLSFGNTLKRVFFGSAFSGMKEAFGNIGQSDLRTLFRLTSNKFLFGVDPKDQAKILSAQVNITGLSKESALSIQKSLMSSAAMRGVLPADVFQDIANNTEQFATFAKDGGQNIGEAAIRARELGISLDTVFKVSDGILDFQSSIENELKASLLIGRQLNLNEARRLAMAGDMAGLQEEILRQVGSEEELQRMNAIQRKSLAGALGVTVTELNKLASGELEVKNSEMKQNTNQMVSLTIAMGVLTATLAGTAGLSLFRGLKARIGIGGANMIGTVSGGKNQFRLLDSAGKQIAGTGAFKTAESAMRSAKLRGLSMTGTRVAGASVMGRTVGALLGSFGAAAVGIFTITAILNKILNKSEETAKNTGRSVRETQFRTQNNMIHASVVSQESGRVAGT